MKKNRFFAALALMGLLLAGCGQTAAPAEPQAPAAPTAPEAPATPEQPDVPAAPVNIEIDVQDYGVIKATLDPAVAPLTVANFVSLVENGFYDGLTFHRIIPGFMIQGGDPQGNGMGGAEQTVTGEFAKNGVENNLSHVRGTLSMARE